VDRRGECGALILGSSPAILGDWSPANFCGACGRPYPWAAAARAAADELIDLLDGLSEQDRETLKGTLDDLVADSAATEVAAVKFKMLAKKAGQEGATALRAIVTSVATEGAKRLILGP
jgi:hypothetical protein